VHGLLLDGGATMSSYCLFIRILYSTQSIGFGALAAFHGACCLCRSTRLSKVYIGTIRRWRFFTAQITSLYLYCLCSIECFYVAMEMILDSF
jgi:hypothetical protein